jgi:hypothetical protein
MDLTDGVPSLLNEDQNALQKLSPSLILRQPAGFLLLHTNFLYAPVG